MPANKNAKKVKIGSKCIGGDSPIAIQTMCTYKTSDIERVIKQIRACAAFGCDIIRVSVADEEDAKAISTIKKEINIPLVADIHFDYRLAILSIENGADKIRINPGNIGGLDRFEKVIECAKAHDIAIRIGLNSGSIFVHVGDDLVTTMVKTAEEYIQFCEKHDFYNIVISLKCSDAIETIKAYRLAHEKFKYPLHLGVTEASIKDVSLIRSTVALAPLLLEGIGDTIRISISDDPIEEIIAAKELLKDCGLYENYPTIISCPTCGRTEVDVFELSNKVNEYLKTINKNIKVAIMGCVVNGPGEAKMADIGLAGDKNEFVLFKHGKIVKKIPPAVAYDILIEEINKM